MRRSGAAGARLLHVERFDLVAGFHLGHGGARHLKLLGPAEVKIPCVARLTPEFALVVETSSLESRSRIIHLIWLIVRPAHSVLDLSFSVTVPSTVIGFCAIGRGRGTVRAPATLAPLG